MREAEKFWTHTLLPALIEWIGPILPAGIEIIDDGSGSLDLRDVRTDRAILGMFHYIADVSIDWNAMRLLDRVQDHLVEDLR